MAAAEAVVVVVNGASTLTAAGVLPSMASRGGELLVLSRMATRGQKPVERRRKDEDDC